MQINEFLSPDAAHCQTLSTLSAAVELGTNAIMKCLGGDALSTQQYGKELTKADISEALAARLAARLGV